MKLSDASSLFEKYEIYTRLRKRDCLLNKILFVLNISGSKILTINKAIFFIRNLSINK